MARTYTLEELKELGTRAPAFVEELKRNSGPRAYDPLLDFDIHHVRKHRKEYLDTQRTQYPVPGPIPDQVTETDVYVDYPPSGSKLQVRVYAPTKPSEQALESGLPVIVLMHEGGWSVGDISDEEHNARLFVSSLDCIAINIEYLLAPENPFPSTHLSCYHVMETLCSSPKTFHALANPSRGLVLGGSSAGGNLAAMLAHHARQQKLSPPVTGVWLGVPFITPTETLPEKYLPMWHSKTSKTDPMIDPGDDERVFKAMYATSQLNDLNSPLVTPFSTSLYPPNPSNNGPELAPLAKAFIQAAGLDPLRDHSIVYAKALQDDWNVEAKLIVYGGYGHMFWSNWPALEASRKFWQDAVEGVGWLLGQKSKREW